MKIAGFYVSMCGAWLVFTTIIGVFAANPPGKPSLPMMQGILAVAPWTGLIAAGIMIIAAGSHLYDKGDAK